MQDPDQRLMARFQKGDLQAFEDLLRKFQGPVLSLVRRYLGSRSPGIDDVAQEVFVRVWRSRATYEPRAKVGTWIYTITVNTCLNEIRRLGADKNRRVAGFSALFGDEGDGEALLRERRADPPPAALEADERGRRVRDAVDGLPSSQRLAVVLTRFHGCSLEEAATAIGTTVPAMKSLLLRARANLRKALGPYVGEASAGAAATRRDDDPERDR